MYSFDPQQTFFNLSITSTYHTNLTITVQYFLTLQLRVSRYRRSNLYYARQISIRQLLYTASDKMAC